VDHVKLKPKPTPWVPPTVRVPGTLGAIADNAGELVETVAKAETVAPKILLPEVPWTTGAGIANVLSKLGYRRVWFAGPGPLQSLTRAAQQAQRQGIAAWQSKFPLTRDDALFATKANPDLLLLESKHAIFVSPQESSLGETATFFTDRLVLPGQRHVQEVVDKLGITEIAIPFLDHTQRVLFELLNANVSVTVGKLTLTREEFVGAATDFATYTLFADDRYVNNLVKVWASKVRYAEATDGAWSRSF
jgi:hypothetical protein